MLSIFFLFLNAIDTRGRLTDTSLWKFSSNGKFYITGIFSMLYFSVALRPNAGYGLILEVSRSHTTTHYSRYDPSGWVISSSQRPLHDNTWHSQDTNILPPPAGFESKVPAKEQPQTQPLDRGYRDWQRYVLFLRKLPIILPQAFSTAFFSCNKSHVYICSVLTTVTTVSDSKEV